MLKSFKIYACPSGTLGLHLSRAPWDPYPWVSDVKDGSSAHSAGVRNGDTVLQLNGNDILGQKIYEIAENIQEHWNNGSSYITIVIWRNQNVNNQNINQQSLQKFASCLQHIAQLLECPICLEVIKPPGRQCCNGHVLCNSCRRRSVKCPVCRVDLGPRGRCLLADKLYNLLAESLPSHHGEGAADGTDYRDFYRSNGDNSSTINYHSSQLHIQEFPKEILSNEQKTDELNKRFNNDSSSNNNNKNNMTIIISTPARITEQHNEYKGPKIWRDFTENWPIISQPLAILIVFILLWAIGYTLFPEYTTPNTGIMRMIFLFVGAQISGILVTFLRLPDMLGMLFFGVLYTNVGFADFIGYQRLEAFLREMALINIMLLAGLGLDLDAFKKLWPMILRLTLLPTVAEVATIAVLAYFLLKMSWLWGILLGLVITAVSPNVVVSVMLRLKEEKLGLNNGIHTLIYAMTACNDVVAIFLFGIFLGLIFSTGNLADQLLQGPIGICIGIVFGTAYGSTLMFLPSKNAKYVNELRFVLTILGGTIAVMGSKAIGYPSAGALGCVAVAFVAQIGWKQQQKAQQNENSSVGDSLDLLWKFLKPVSFSLIGKEINFAVLDGHIVGYGLILVLCGSLMRSVTSYLSTYGGDLTPKERAFITISGFPKATVQAALGPNALDLARSLNANNEILSLASNVLIISVIAIIVTAPLGAVLMLRLAPICLQKFDNSGNEEIEGNTGGAGRRNRS